MITDRKDGERTPVFLRNSDQNPLDMMSLWGKERVKSYAMIDLICFPCSIKERLTFGRTYIPESISKYYICLIVEIIRVCAVGLSSPSLAASSDDTVCCVGGFWAGRVTLMLGEFLPLGAFHTSRRVRHTQQDSVFRY